MSSLFSVIPGLVPGIHTTRRLDGWIRGSSPRMTRKILLALMASVVLAPIAHADTAPAALTTDQMQLAMQVVQAIGIQQVADSAVDGLKIVLVQSLAANSKQAPDKVEPIVDAVLMPDIKASEPQFVTTVATLYGQAFTVPEMQQILAFYQTPVGQKLQGITPALTHQMVEAGHAWIGQIGEQVLKLDADKLTAQGLKVD